MPIFKLTLNTGLKINTFWELMQYVSSYTAENYSKPYNTIKYHEMLNSVENIEKILLIKLTFSCQCNMPIIARMKTQTPINAIAVSSTMLLGVRYSLALQLYKRGKSKETLITFIRKQKIDLI